MGKVLSKVGEIIKADSDFVEVKTSYQNEILPTQKIIRMEVLKDDG